MCTPKAHPFQTLRVEGNCAGCEREREERLRRVFGGEVREESEEGNGMVEKVRFDEWKWKVKYAAPNELEMDLGREVAARERIGEGTEVGDGEGSKRMSVMRKMVRWRWKRGSWRKSDGSSRFSGSVKSPVNLKSPR